MILYIYNINETVIFPRLIWPFFVLFFCCQQYINNFIIIYKTEFLFLLIPVQFASCRLLQANLLQHFIHFFNKEKTSAETATKLNLISSIWNDDHIRRVDEKNWQCLWCNQTFQGINATKALAHLLEKKVMHIKSCYVAKDKAHTTSYQKIQNYKQAREGFLHHYSENIRASITSLQNN